MSEDHAPRLTGKEISVTMSYGTGWMAPDAVDVVMRRIPSELAARRARNCESLGLIRSAARWYERACDLRKALLWSVNQEWYGRFLVLSVAAQNHSDPETLVWADHLAQHGRPYVYTWDTGRQRIEIPAEEWQQLLYLARTRGRVKLP